MASAAVAAVGGHLHSVDFLTYLVLMLASFVSLELICNFFELINDMLRNNIPL